MAPSGLLATLKRLFGSAPDLTPEQEEELRRLHLERCHNFKLLLAANNRALEVMSDVEEALRGERAFGAGYVREACTRVASEVFAMVRGLTSLAPGRYDGLLPRFRAIQSEINAAVLTAAPRSGGPLVRPLADLGAADLDQAGGKLANLGELARALGAAIPRGFAVTAAGFSRFMAHDDLQAEVDRRIQAADASRLDEIYALSSSLQGLIAAAPLPPDLEEAIRGAAQGLAAEAPDGGKRLLLAVRSSAIGEDALGASFAGQYHTELGVDPDEVVQAYREVVAAKYGVTAMTYRLVRGIPDEAVPMCVGVMEMVDAAASGVAYSRDPLHPDEGSGGRVLIEAVPGLPKAVVDGSAAVDRFLVDRDPLALAGVEAARKEFRYAPSAGAGLDRIPLAPEEAGRPCLDEARALAVARLALAAERHFNGPQDLEWAFDPDGRLVLLQCRPLKEAAAAAATTPPPGPANRDLPVLLAGGVAASPGAAAGPAFVARKDADALRFPPGGVLVVAQALPFWATLLSRAAAVVAERGAAAGHLANVAREYGVPALFGLEGALAGLDGAGLVTVDADGRRVLPGDATADLPRRAPRRNLMLGSPVLDLLERAARHIVPLTLLDPSAPDFAPEGCATLHDVTRFCHEKSVEEMFSQGADLPLPTHAARRLSVDGKAMQYWVIDLGDGIRSEGSGGEAQGKTVPLAQIASAPMLALWRGMTAAPWAGPPVDARGFMSVLAGSASNPDLDPGAASAFAERNYFMIASDFCSLQSRFGYHFSTVEALIGDEDAGNYLSFRFKGGAADHCRRTRRTEMIAELLEELGFRCETKADALFARMEGYGKDFMEERLAALGHVIVHTRQMDMAMSDAAQAGAFKARLLTDITGRLGVRPGP